MKDGVRRVVVVGLMGAGKTVIGSRVAELLGWDFDDSDAAIEREQGQNVRELRDSIGTDRMHEMEAQHLLSALERSGIVIAAAASVIDVDACLEALRDETTAVLWLRARPETLAARFRDQPHRPWYGSDPEAFLADQADRREPRFAEVASVIVDVDDRSVEEAATVSHAALASLPSGRPLERDRTEDVEA